MTIFHLTVISHLVEMYKCLFYFPRGTLLPALSTTPNSSTNS